MDVQADGVFYPAIWCTCDLHPPTTSSRLYEAKLRKAATFSKWRHVWFTTEAEDWRGSTVKYLRSAGLCPIEGREGRRDDGGGGLEVWKMRKGENDVKLHSSNFSVFITYLFYCAIIMYMCSRGSYILSITSPLINTRKSKYSRCSNDLLERFLWSGAFIYVGVSGICYYGCILHQQSLSAAWSLVWRLHVCWAVCMFMCVPWPHIDFHYNPYKRPIY